MPWMAMRLLTTWGILISTLAIAQAEPEVCESPEAYHFDFESQLLLPDDSFVPQFNLNAIGFDQPVQVKIDRLHNVDFTNEQRIRTAAQLLNRIFDTEEFHQKIMAFTYQGQKQFWNNRGLSNQKIYDAIQLGRERRAPEGEPTFDDQLMNLDIEMYYKENSVIGYTETFKAPIFVNRYHYDGKGVRTVLQNLLHEWLHNVGFKHGGREIPYALKQFSVPYGVGRIAYEISYKYY